MPRHNAAEAIPAPETKPPKPEKHLKLFEDTKEIQLEDSDLEEIDDLTHEAKEEEGGVVELKDTDLEEIEDLTGEATLEPTWTEQATEAIQMKKAGEGSAKARGREARAIREIQEKLAMDAVEELHTEAKEEASWEKLSKEQTTKPVTKIVSRWGRFKSWILGK